MRTAKHVNAASADMSKQFYKPAHVTGYAEKIVLHSKNYLPILQMTGAAICLRAKNHFLQSNTGFFSS